MSSASTPKPNEPDDGRIRHADESLAHAHEVMKGADEQLARLSEQVAKMESEAARQSSAASSPPSAPGKPALRGRIGLPLAACVVVAALVLQWSQGWSAKLAVALWPPPQIASAPSIPKEDLPPSAQPAPSYVQLAQAEPAPPPVTPIAQAAPQDAAPATTATVPDQTQLLQTMARDLANLERSIEQLKDSQQQIAKMAGDNSKDIAELRASQDEIKRTLTKVSEQNLSRPSPPPAQPAVTLRKPERTVQPPRVRARPRYLREEWYYDDW